MVVAVGCSNGGSDKDSLIKGVVMTLNQNTGDFTVNTTAKAFVNFDPTEGDKLIIFGDDMGHCFWKLAVADMCVFDYNANTKIATINLLEIMDQGISRIMIHIWKNDTKAGQEFQPIIAYDLPELDQEYFVRITDTTSLYDSAGDVVFAFDVDQHTGTIDIVRGQPILARNYAGSNCDSDGDGDGVTEADGDCDDRNVTVYPGAYDIPDDGIDQDCNGEDATGTVDPLDIDDDGDGYTENEGDCNDYNVNVYPGAIEICEDGIDQDCNGSDLNCSPTPPPVTDECVDVEFDEANGILRYKNAKIGFEGFDISQGTVYVVSDKTDMNNADAKENGIPLVLEEDGSLIFRPAQALFTNNDSRYMFVYFPPEGKYEWEKLVFNTIYLCPEDKEALERKTESPEAPWADGDTVMALWNLFDIVPGDTVSYRGAL